MTEQRLPMDKKLGIFVSHAKEDKAFCDIIVKALRSAGADVWYDEDDMKSGPLMKDIQSQLANRPIFIVVLSKAAFTSSWVWDECAWAYNLSKRKPNWTILPVVGGAYDQDDFDKMLHLEDMRRIETPNHGPYAPDEAAKQLLDVLALAHAGDSPASVGPRPTEGIDDLLTGGKALAERGKYAQARRLLERAAQLAPGSFSAWANLGNIYIGLKRYRKALKACERALKLDDKQGWVWSKKAAAYNGLTRYKEALEAGDQALHFYEDLAEAWNNKGTALIGLNRYDEALEAFDQAHTYEPQFAEAWNNKGAALNALKRYDEALEACDQALALDPNLTLAWVNKGVAFGGLGLTADAYDAYSQALGYRSEAEGVSRRGFNSNDARHWNSVGSMLDKMGLYEDAVTHCDKALFIDPKYAMAWNNKGIALRNTGRNDDAKAAYRNALHLDPGLAEAWNNMGVAFAGLGRYRDALRLYNRALRINPNFATAWSNKAVALQELNRPSEAETADQKATELDE